MSMTILYSLLLRCVSVHSILQSVPIIHLVSFSDGLGTRLLFTIVFQHVPFNVCLLLEQLKDFMYHHKHTMFMHDFSNNLYSYNIYCMHSVD